MSVIRMPAQLVMPERTDRRSLLRTSAGLGLGLGAASLIGSAGAQDHNHLQGTPASTPASDGGSYVGSEGTTQGTGDATPGPGAEVAEFQRYDPYLAPANGTKEVEVVAADRTIWIDKKTQYAAWTFNGTVPGKPLRAKQGDTIHVTVRNDAAMTHNVDFHSARVSPEEGYKLVQPGDTFEWDMKLDYPGAYMVHCGTAPVLVHIATGMYFPMIVDPADGGFEPATEIVLSQSEFYTMPGEGGIHVTDAERLFEMTAYPNIVCFNGHASQYVDEPIEIPVGELVRIYMVNHGPNVWSAFHVVGAIFQAAYLNANPKNKLEGLQTISVGPGDGVAVEFIVDEPGDYVAVNHSFGHAAHGAIAILRAR
jgi:nitrite reductase (NO-forming)